MPENIRKMIKLFVLLMGVFFQGWAIGAVIVQNGGLTIQLEGSIAEADSKKLISILNLIEPERDQKYPRPPVFMDLNSTGGDVNEALTIASIVRSLHMQTRVKKTGTCASSCFFVWISGLARYSYSYRNGMNPMTSGVIGIHRPYFLNPKAGPDALVQQENLMRAVEKYLKDMRVSQSIIDVMMHTSSRDIHWLDENERKLVGGYAAGFEEQMMATCFPEIKSNESSGRNMMLFFAAQQEAMACISKTYVENYRSSAVRALVQIQSGWIPWD